MNLLLRWMVEGFRFLRVRLSRFIPGGHPSAKLPPKPVKLPLQELLRRGSREVQRGRYDQGITWLEKALEQEPAHFVAHINVGSAYYLRAEENQRKLQRHPPGEAAELEEAVARDLTAAQGHLEHVLALDPNHTQALLNLAAVYSGQGRLEESIALLQRVLQIDPQHPDGHYNLATAYLRQGDWGRAQEELRRELEVNPDSPHVQELLRRLRGKEKGKP